MSSPRSPNSPGAEAMLSRALDIVVSATGLALSAPFILFGIVGIKLASPGPAFFRARRMGRSGRPFEMLKLRTMHVDDGRGAQITSANDARVFQFGRFLRASKIDELPQLWNVLTGEMSLVGPRPEAVGIVKQHYTDWMMETLAVRPGVTSPGAIFYYTRGEHLVDDADPEGSYARDLLPPKLAIERAYIERQTVFTDIAVIARTIWTVLAILAGKRNFALPSEAARAKRWARFDQETPRAADRAARLPIEKETRL